jgi:threonine/homoserine/homoserine lactone efflux protein
MIVFTDALKALLARQIRARIRPVHLFWLRRIVGVAFIIFGLGMLWRAW